MKDLNFKYISSIVAGLISTTVVGYSLLAPVWGLEHADKLFSTGSIAVMVLSMLLSVFTGQKISKKHSPESMLESTQDYSVYELTDNNREDLILLDEDRTY